MNMDMEGNEQQRLLEAVKHNPQHLVTISEAALLRQAGYTGDLNILEAPAAAAPSEKSSRTESEGPDFSGQNIPEE